MLNTFRKKLIASALLIIGVVGISSAVFLSQQQQDTRSRASASTTLSLSPTTSTTAPLRKTVGENASFDVIITPGNNRPSLVKLEILFDATKLKPTSSPFVVNTSAFPVTQEGPIIQAGKILISVSVGSDPSKAISQTTKVGTVNFTTIATTDANTTTISFGGSSQVLSVASQDHASENVLSSTTPAYVAIANLPTSTPIPPSATPSPTPIRKAGDGGVAGNGGGGCSNGIGGNGGAWSAGSNTTGGTGGTGGTGCSGTGIANAGGIGGTGGTGSSTGAGNPGQNGANGTGNGAGGGGGGGGGGAPGQPGGRGGDGGTGCNGAPGQPGLPGEPAPNANTGGKGGRGGDGGTGCSPTSTPTPTNMPTPTPTRVPTATPTPIPPTATPTSVPNSTKLSITVFMHGIGNSGDNANETNHSLSNKNPLNKTRNVEVQIVNTANQVIASTNTIVTYNSSTGNFRGIADFERKIPTSGTYNVKVKSPTHLRRLVPGVQNISVGITNNIPAIHVVTGDINNDNALNILDYNILVGCYSDLAPAKSCTATNKSFSDLNDNGDVNQLDYNLFLREISVQTGQ